MSHPTKKIFALFIFWFSAITVFAQPGQDIYLSPTGNDKNTGTIEKPFSSLDAALHSVHHSKAGLPVTIFLRGGKYFVPNTIVINDSAMMAGHKLTITNYKNEKVVITGGLNISHEKFHRINDASILQRLSPAARQNVYETSLDDAGISNFGQRVPHGFARESIAPLELFFNDNPLPLARWPNSGVVPIGAVSDHGSIPRNGNKDNHGARFSYNFDRPSGWKKSDDIWLYGIFAHSYADDNVPVENIDQQAKTIQLAAASYYGVFGNEEMKESHGQAARGYYFYNVLEELDSVGEWWLDKETHKLYVWPPSTIANADINVSMLDDPLLILRHVSDITITGIEFGFGRGMGMYLSGTDHVTISHCVLMNFGTRAIVTNDGDDSPAFSSSSLKFPKDRFLNKRLTISQCRIFNTGTGAVTLNGGDRKSLTPGGNAITDCELYNYSRINRASPPGLIVGGTGNLISHCFIHDGSSAAIGYSGNNHEISYNHILQVATEFSDIGAVYTGRDPSSTGNKIINNFFDNIQSQFDYAIAAVYIDDGSGGIDVSDNIFYHCGNSKGYGAVHINGGADNNFDNNYFIECPKAFSNTVWDDKKWKAAMFRPDMIKKLTKDVDIQSPAYLAQYPHLKSFFDTTGTLVPRTNKISNSLLFKVPIFTTGKTTFEITNSYSSADGSEFSDIEHKNFALKISPDALKQASGWKAIPFEKIGIRQ